ncbi:hypothetical protein GCM10007989_36000 [Devosia pacifica]|uniref:Uncharacterized protein n=1 Tax=Devosia pacifica TaxID=1335967 RepID=A0A918VZ68_9HYPH|nr:DUF6157 family protein [Devosia pacifica]GHA36676.1 hypothetical protein GCM10007989_36000 [Devosia pacifica]
MAHTTNYFNTVILPAEDSASVAKIPAKPDSVAGLQFGMLVGNPYQHTSDDVLSAVAAVRNGIPEAERDAYRQIFFSKGQPCFRASPLTKTHGWAVHADAQGRMALVDPASGILEDLTKDAGTKVLMAMRTKRA